MTTLETLKWDGKKAGEVSIDLKVSLGFTTIPDLLTKR